MFCRTHFLFLVETANSISQPPLQVGLHVPKSAMDRHDRWCFQVWPWQTFPWSSTLTLPPLLAEFRRSFTGLWWPRKRGHRWKGKWVSELAFKNTSTDQKYPYYILLEWNIHLHCEGPFVIATGIMTILYISFPCLLRKLFLHWNLAQGTSQQVSDGQPLSPN